MWKKPTLRKKLINIFSSKFVTTIQKLITTFCQNREFVSFELTEKQPVKERQCRAGSGRAILLRISIIWSKGNIFCSISDTEKFNSFQDIALFWFPMMSVEWSSRLRLAPRHSQIQLSITLPFFNYYIFVYKQHSDLFMSVKGKCFLWQWKKF